MIDWYIALVRVFVLLYYCIIALSQNCIIALLYYCIIVLVVVHLLQHLTVNAKKLSALVIFLSIFVHQWSEQE